jgi:hypothetical protein
MVHLAVKGLMQFKSLARVKHMGFLEAKGRISVDGISRWI